MNRVIFAVVRGRDGKMGLGKFSVYGSLMTRLSSDFFGGSGVLILEKHASTLSGNAWITCCPELGCPVQPREFRIHSFVDCTVYASGFLVRNIHKDIE